MKIVSFYCDVDNTFYSECAKKLKQNLDDLRIEHIIKNKSFGDTWIENVRAKPLFLKEVQNELNEDFIWLDVDCRVIKKIDFIINTAWGFLPRANNTPNDFVHYVSNTEESKNFISKWIEQIELDRRGSHSAFNIIINKISYSYLPDGYFELGLSDVYSKQQYFK